MRSLACTQSDQTAPIVRRDVDTSLAQLHQLAGTVSRLSRSGASDPLGDGNSELQWAIAELKANLRTIEPDLEELEESVAAVAEPGVAARLGISDREVQARRDFVERVKGEVAVRNECSALPYFPFSDPFMPMHRRYDGRSRRKRHHQCVVYCCSRRGRMADDYGIRRFSTENDIQRPPPDIRRLTTPTMLEVAARTIRTTRTLLLKPSIKR